MNGKHALIIYQLLTVNIMPFFINIRYSKASVLLQHSEMELMLRRITSSSSNLNFS